MSSQASVTYVGHSTILIEMDGLRLITDPLLRRFIGPLKRLTSLPNLETLDIDAVLISHLHGDHFDLASLKTIGHETLMIVPKGAGNFLKLRRFKNVVEIEQGEVYDIGQIRISATMAIHGGKQLPWTPLVEPLGFLIDGQHEIYFAGDTDLFLEMADIGQQLDLALLPVWGWGPNLGQGHMDPLRAAEALLHLNPDHAVPIHWGTYCPVGLSLFRPRFLIDPPFQFAEHAAKIAPDVTVQILQPGQELTLLGS